MNVASLKLCKELFELSGWGDTEKIYGYFMKHQVAFDDEPTLYTRQELEDAEGYAIRLLCSAYDLGYLLRKLPKPFGLNASSKEYRFSCVIPFNEFGKSYGASADTPEDAACKLAIELIKAGVLK